MIWVKAKNEISLNWKLHNCISVFNLIIINNVLALCAFLLLPRSSENCCNVTHPCMLCRSLSFLVCTLNPQGDDVSAGKKNHWPAVDPFTKSIREQEVRRWTLVQSTPAFCRHGTDCTSSACGKNSVVASFSLCPFLMIAAAASHISENWPEIGLKTICSFTIFFSPAWADVKSTAEIKFGGPGEKKNPAGKACVLPKGSLFLHLF